MIVDIDGSQQIWTHILYAKRAGGTVRESLLKRYSGVIKCEIFLEQMPITASNFIVACRHWHTS